MANLIEYIQSQVYENSTEDISGSIMQQVLTRMASDEGVVNVHTISGQTPFADYNNAQAARGAVPDGFKKLGLIITYKLSSGWYIDEFIGSATSGWSTSSNWKCLGPISVSQNAETGKTTITIGSQSYDVATQPVSVSQNTSTGHTDINIGDVAYPVASADEAEHLSEELGVGETIEVTGNTQIFKELPFLKNGYEIEIKLLSDSVTPVSITFYTATNNQTVQTLGQITEINGVLKKTLNADAEQIYSYNNSGSGNYSYSVKKLGVVDTANETKKKVDILDADLISETKVFSDSHNHYYDLSFLKEGTYVELTLTADSGNSHRVSFFTTIGTTVIQDLYVMSEINNPVICRITDDANRIYCNSNNGNTSPSFTIRKLTSYEKADVQNKLSQDKDVDGIVSVYKCIIPFRLLENLTYSSGKSYLIPVRQGQKLKVKSGAKLCTLDYISSIVQLPVVNELSNHVGNHIYINASTTYTSTVPNGAEYALIEIYSVTEGDTTPEYVYLDDVRVDVNIRDVLENIYEGLNYTNSLISNPTREINSPVTGNRKQINIIDSLITQGRKVVVTLVSKAEGTINISLGYIKTDSSFSTIGTFTSVGQTKEVLCNYNNFDHLLTYNNADSNAYTISYKIKGVTDEVEPLKNDVKELTDSDVFAKLEIADGALDKSCVDDSEYFVKTKVIDSHVVKEKRTTKNIVAINHDDFRLCDIEGARRVYNKYGFRANFNFMFFPFDAITNKNKRITAVKKLIKEGHGIGLHNYFGNSFWWMNKLFDIKPDGTALYAPTLSELRDVVQDGKNVFGVTITSSTKFRDVQFETLPSALNVEIANATQDDWRAAIGFMCVYFNKATYTGYDLADNQRTWTFLKWTEYFYNELIDNTLGYSSEETNYADMYSEDYEVPEGASLSDYYPDITHLENGKIVFFDDTDNPNYNNAEYQKVGRFSKGLFKGCATTRNCEVAGRIIETATAFCRHYYNMVRFDNFGRHGEGFCYAFWEDSNGFKYENRDKTILTYETQKVLLTSTGQFKSLFEVLKDYGIKVTNHGNNGYSMGYPVLGNQKLFIGQSDIVGKYDNQSDVVSYLDFFGPEGSSIAEMTYSTFMSFAGSHKDWLKWAYESAGQTITNGDSETMQMYTYIKRYIDTIRRCIGTGKIPAFSVDTIRQSPNIIAAIEIICQFCYANDITIVPMEEARRIACRDRNIQSNMFANPAFNQMLLRMFGGSSTSVDAYIPDGWSKNINDEDYEFEVSYDSVNHRREFTMARTGSSYGCVTSRIYGLGPGKYKFTAYIKTTNVDLRAIGLYARYADELVGSTPTHIIIESGHPSEWTLVEQEFIIEPPYKDTSNNSAVNRLCDGYSNNLVYFELRMYAESGKETSISLPCVKLI